MAEDHSPLGGSAVERYMNCPGSVNLLELLKLPESDEEDVTTEGTALHEAVAQCLRDGADAWEVTGVEFHGIEITAEHATMVQSSLDLCRKFMKPHAKTYVEAQLSAPAHKDFRGTIDFGSVMDSLLVQVDHKFGFIDVDVVRNPQFMYYAYMLLLHHPEVRRVVLYVHQPRGFNVDGPIRKWETTAEEICAWVNDTLLPAMKRTEASQELCAGDWCRYCPAKLVCPLLASLFQTACTYDPKAIPALDDVSLGQSAKLGKAVEHYVTALEKEVERRLRIGIDVQGWKMVPKRARRVWKDGAEAALRKRFGDIVIDPPSLKSPAQVEQLHDDAKTFVSTYAYTPESGLTIARTEDSRVAVKPQKPSAVFKGTVTGE